MIGRNFGSRRVGAALQAVNDSLDIPEQPHLQLPEPASGVAGLGADDEYGGWDASDNSEQQPVWQGVPPWNPNNDWFKYYQAEEYPGGGTPGTVAQSVVATELAQKGAVSVERAAVIAAQNGAETVVAPSGETVRVVTRDSVPAPSNNIDPNTFYKVGNALYRMQAQQPAANGTYPGGYRYVPQPVQAGMSPMAIALVGIAAFFLLSK